MPTSRKPSMLSVSSSANSGPQAPFGLCIRPSGFFHDAFCGCRPNQYTLPAEVAQIVAVEASAPAAAAALGSMRGSGSGSARAEDIRRILTVCEAARSLLRSGGHHNVGARWTAPTCSRRRMPARMGQHHGQQHHAHRSLRPILCYFLNP